MATTMASRTKLVVNCNKCNKLQLNVTNHKKLAVQTIITKKCYNNKLITSTKTKKQQQRQTNIKNII